MIKRTLLFGNPAYLSLNNSQLVIERPELKALGEKEAKKSIPIEDIGIVLLDHPQITLTHGCIQALLQNNAVVVACGASHHPTGMLLPIEGHETQSERYRCQAEASAPLKKQLWQQTVQAKILNQAAVLAERGIDCENMLYWARSVRSGDPDNYEGRAAAYYWRYVFSEEAAFLRGREGEPPNNLLNYGYAVLRAMTARALVCAGLLPTLGIHHRNKYNAYCLADDVMEPYRPYVDQIVLQVMDDGEDFTELSTAMKAQLLAVGSVDVRFDKGRSPLMVGLQTTASSLTKCFEQKARKIQYPVLPAGKRVRYPSGEYNQAGIAAEPDGLYNNATGKGKKKKLL